MSTNQEEKCDYWAYDSHNNELDPLLKEAHKVALLDASPSEAELSEPLIIRNLLTSEQIDKILFEASAEGVWPRGVKKDDSSNLPDDLKSVPHHFAWPDRHVALYMHNNDHWFARALPESWSVIRGGMESQHGQEAVPEIPIEWVGSDQYMQAVRTIELHHYSSGGGLLIPGHRDSGSDLTISVLLSDPDDVEGGDFVTYNGHSDEREPVAHKMGRGDAILFRSEKLHNISTVRSGVRKSLVVELWPTKRY